MSIGSMSVLKTGLPSWGLVLSVVLLFLYACHGGDASKTVVTVNGQGISLDDFQERMEGTLAISGKPSSLKPEEMDPLREEVLNSLIDEKIMLLRAEALSLAVRDEELQKKVGEIKEGYSVEGFKNILEAQGISHNAWEKALKKRMIFEKLIASDVNSKIFVTEKEARAYYEIHRKEYITETKVHVLQIVSENRQEAGKILNRLKNREDFGKVAREVSVGIEAAHGGDLGFVEQGDMPEDIDRAIFSLPVGVISNVVKSPYGYHLFKVLEKQKRKRDFSDIKEQVISDIRKQKEGKAYLTWLSDLRSRAVIKIDRDLLKTIMVPQIR
jgi:parvulin-like peptidyl-prolyl isomerase